MVNEDVGSGAGERSGDHATHPASAAGYDSDLSLDLHVSTPCQKVGRSPGAGNRTPLGPVTQESLTDSTDWTIMAAMIHCATGADSPYAGYRVSAEEPPGAPVPI